MSVNASPTTLPAWQQLAQLAALPQPHLRERLAQPGRDAMQAAADGTVAAVTKDTEGTPIVVIRHADNILTVYAGVDGVKLAKGAAVKRGQVIATVRAGNPAFLHFEVRKGVDSVDPMPYLQ